MGFLEDVGRGMRKEARIQGLYAKPKGPKETLGMSVGRGLVRNLVAFGDNARKMSADSYNKNSREIKGSKGSLFDTGKGPFG